MFRRSGRSNFERLVRAKLREYDYTLHPRKGWAVWQRRDEPEITGLVLDRRGGVDVPESMQRIIRELAHSHDRQDQQRLAGYRAHQAMIKPST